MLKRVQHDKDRLQHDINTISSIERMERQVLYREPLDQRPKQTKTKNIFRLI
ncbi:hypothetical protein [Flavisericum labens]|uniref:hypothetical protein n=1 Tax=Flavisericum labens TaxID=3377112 RepID=UPI00387B13A6